MTYRTRSLSAADGAATSKIRRSSIYVAPVAALLLAVALSSPGAAQSATPAPAAPAAAASDPTSAEAGKGIFETVGCSSCHGAAGEGVVGPKLVGSTTARNVGTLVQRILYGGGDMPPFNTLSDDEVAAVANYVRTVFNKQTVLVTAQDVAGAR